MDNRTKQEALAFSITGNRNLDMLVLVAVVAVTYPLWTHGITEAGTQMYNEITGVDDTSDASPASDEKYGVCEQSPTGYHVPGPEKGRWDPFFNDGTQARVVNCMHCGEFLETRAFE